VHNKFAVAALIVATSAVPAAAQVTIDASQITCSQFVHHRIAPTRLIGAWLSGYYNGKADNRVLNMQTFQKKLGQLQSFCSREKNFDVPVMQAVEQLFSGGR
jgi:acid stress chaperone HdeB